MLTTLLGWFLTVAAAQPLPAPPASTPPATPPLIASWEIVTLSEGVHGFIWTKPFDNPIQGNALFIVNDRDVVVVDSGLLPSTARVMAAELKKLTPKPVRYVINTHWHDDHHGGNAVYRELWPEVQFIAHRNTRADIIEKTYGERTKSLDEALETAARYERWAAAGKDDDGKPIDERRRKRMAEIAALDRALVPELRAIPEMPPDVTFDDRLVLYRGARTIEIRWLGQANTRGDTVIVLPKERIAASGDLLVYPIPFMFGSYHEQWPKTLDALDALPVDTLFPGHGPVLRDRTYLHQVLVPGAGAQLGDVVGPESFLRVSRAELELVGLLQALFDRVKAAVAAGATLEETQRQVTLADWKTTLAGDDPEKQRAFDVFVLQPGIERAWRQARGEPDK